jgi:DNA-binding transcriptional regulator YdaS (Cro superfamily)
MCIVGLDRILHIVQRDDMTKLQEHLKSNRISIRDFAARIGVHDSVLSRFSRGLARPSLDTAFAIERATNGAVPASSWVAATDKET